MYPCNILCYLTLITHYALILYTGTLKLPECNKNRQHTDNYNEDCRCTFHLLGYFLLYIQPFLQNKKRSQELINKYAKKEVVKKAKSERCVCRLETVFSLLIVIIVLPQSKIQILQRRKKNNSCYNWMVFLSHVFFIQ